MPKYVTNYSTIALISHAIKVMLKILQARLHQYMNQELPDVQAGFRKGSGTRDQIAKIHLIIEKGKRIPEKNICFCFIDYTETFDHVDHNKLWKILKDDATLNMPANLENSAVATGLEKVSFHSNLKERQCQRMSKISHNSIHTLAKQCSKVSKSGFNST